MCGGIQFFFVNNSYKICNKYVKFSPHPKSLDDISKTSVKELTRLRFNDDDTALANIVKAMENAPSSGLRKKDINKIVEKTMAKGTAIFCNEMQTMKTCLTS